VYERLAERAGLDLAPACCWLLLRIEEHRPSRLSDLAARLQVPPEVLGPRLKRLGRSGLIAARTETVGPGASIMLSEAGRAAAERLVAARRAGLEAEGQRHVASSGIRTTSWRPRRAGDAGAVGQRPVIASDA
jgi:hypothetical protein